VCLLEKGQTSEASALFATIPAHLAQSGSKNELEVFVARRVKRFLEKKKSLPEASRLFQPATELAYLWNGFTELKASTAAYLTKLEAFESEAANKDLYSDDDRIVLLLLKGGALKAVGKVDDAKQVLDRVAQQVPEREKFVVPFALYELALLHLAQGNLEEAERHAKLAQKSHSGYDFETRLHYRLSATLEYLQSKKK